MAAPPVLGGGDPATLRAEALALARAVAGSGQAGEGPGLYAGEAGIGWLLAHVAAHAGDAELAGAAADRLDAAAAAADDAALTPWLADGRAGIALALVQGGRALRSERHVAAGRAAAARAAEAAIAGGEAEYLSGLAGVIVALAAVGRDDRPEPLLDGARAAGEHLLGAARRTPWGWAWDVPGLTGGSVAPLCGLAHGSAGVGLGLHELAAMTGEARWAAAGEDALRYTRAFFRRQACGWPDLRFAAAGDAAALDAGCGSSWCHGAVGIGLAFLRVHELTGDLGALADASAALQAARHAAAALARQGAADASLCHGTGGLVELYAAAAQLLGGHDHVRAARRVAHAALAASAPEGQSPLKGQSPFMWRSGELDGHSTPGLFLGSAGIAAWLMRAADPAALPSPLLVR